MYVVFAYNLRFVVTNVNYNACFRGNEISNISGYQLLQVPEETRPLVPLAKCKHGT